jgi:hypothetical protein
MLKNKLKNLIQYFKNKFSPIQQILILSALVRLISVFFSKGFGFHDDHFLIIESSQSWVDNFDYNYWLPSEEDPNRQPSGHPLFYVGLQYFVFKIFKILAINDPQMKMLMVRFIHAAWSLLIVKFGYLIAEKLSNQKTAIYVALLLGLYWFMPFVSVRNLAEFVCLPAFMWGIWLLVKEINYKNFLFAGILFGVAFSIRFQVVFMLAGVGISLLILKTPFKQLLALGFGFLLTIFITCGLVDFILWNKPFAEFLSYIQYNIDNAGVYGTNNWHMYFDLIFGLLIPPLSFALFYGYFYSYKKTIIIFWSVFVYLAFHTYFPNKQERFVLTIFPLLIISGTIGAFMLYENYKLKLSPKLVTVSKWFVIILNCILLLFLSPSYGKRHRVESVYYLSKKTDCTTFFIEDSNKENDYLMPPLFYFGKWFSVCGINKNYNADSALVYYNQTSLQPKPNYVIFMQAENIESRVAAMKKNFPDLRYEATIEPSLLDKTLFWLNPLNDNQTAFIYKLK